MIAVTNFLRVVVLIGCVPAPVPARGEDRAADDKPEFVVKADAIRKETDEKLKPIYVQIKNEMATAKSDVDRDRVFLTYRPQIDSVKAAGMQRVLQELTPHAADSSAVSPLIWIVNSGSDSDAGSTAAGLLMKHHLVHRETLEVAAKHNRGPTGWCEAMLRAQLAAKDLPEEFRWRIMLSLADCLKARGEVAATLSDADNALRREFEQSFGDKYFAEILVTGQEAYEAEAVQLFEEVGKTYQDIEIRGDITVGDIARLSIFQIEQLGIGKVPPDIEGEDLNGVKFRLSDYRGKVVMLIFWASWCPGCMAAVPHENQLFEQYKHRPFELVGVNSDIDREQLKPVLENHKITWRSFWDGNNGPAGPIAKSWNIINWPRTFLIDHTGVIRAFDLPPRHLETKIQQLVAEAEKADHSATRQ